MSMTLTRRASAHPRDVNPVDLTYPATLPIEVALHATPIKTICEDYGLSREDWERLRHDPLFIADVARVVEELKKDGMSFKLKARLQSEELLKKSWQMIHAPTDEVPPAVRADLIKFTVRVAGLDAGLEKAEQSVGNALSIQINLG